MTIVFEGITAADYNYQKEILKKLALMLREDFCYLDTSFILKYGPIVDKILEE